MVASLTADQEIDQAIERLQKKMQAVSDNLDRGRNYKKSSQKRVKGKSRQGKNKSSLNRPLKYLFIFITMPFNCFHSLEVYSFFRCCTSAQESNQTYPYMQEP